MPDTVSQAITAAAAGRDLGTFTAVAHAPSRTTGSTAPRSHGGSAAGGVSCIILGLAATALGVAGIIDGQPLGGYLSMAALGLVIAWAGRWMVRDHRRERTSDTFHFAHGFVQWNTETGTATAWRWSDFHQISDRFFTTTLYLVPQSVDYRVTFSCLGGDEITLSATAPTRKRLLSETTALRAMVEAAKRG